MTARHHYDLVCDADDCNETFNVHKKRADETRESAARAGWVHGIEMGGRIAGPVRSLDYCPKHAAMLGDLRPKALPQHAHSSESTQ